MTVHIGISRPKQQKYSNRSIRIFGFSAVSRSTRRRANSPTRQLAHSDDSRKLSCRFPRRVRHTCTCCSQAVVSRSDKCVTRLVGEITSCTFGELACWRVDLLYIVVIVCRRVPWKGRRRRPRCKRYSATTVVRCSYSCSGSCWLWTA